MRDVPAFVQTGRLDVVASNALARALYADLFDHTGPHDPRDLSARPPNHARFTFLDPRATRLYPDWEHAARDTVALLRAEAGRQPADRQLNELVGELATRSDRFSALWATHDVRWHTAGTKRLHHHVAGDLTLAYEGLQLPADPGHTLITFTAAPESPSAQALQFLANWAAAPQEAAAPTRDVERGELQRLDDRRST
jgi:hypothetical protein